MTTSLLLLMLSLGASAVAADPERLPTLPDKEGFAGCFAGVSNGVLLVAGGANFPDKKPWEGGRKVWYDTIFALDRPDGSWRIAGRLPRPLGYGVSVTQGQRVVCVGGSDADRHHAEAFRLDWQGGRVRTTPLRPLPQPLANACGALVGDILYVAGGLQGPEDRATVRTVWQIDLAAAEPQWRALPPLPGSGRMLAVAAAFDGAFHVAGGVDLAADAGKQVQRRYLTDAYRYAPGTGWQRLPDLPHPVAAAPSPAPADATGFYLLGGDDGSQVSTPPERQRGFHKIVLRFDPSTRTWVEAGTLGAARVTAPCIRWHETWVIASGEIRPGVRSPEVWSWKPRSEE